MDKENTMCINNGMLFILKKKELSFICDDIFESGEPSVK